MSVTPGKISIAKSISVGNKASRKPGVKGAIKPTDKIAKSAQSGDANASEESGSENNDGDAEFVTDDGGKWEAGKPISTEASVEKAIKKYEKDKWTGFYDLKRKELETNRAINQDNLDFQKWQTQQALAQQNAGIGPAIAAQGIGALTGLLAGAKGGGGGGSSGGGGTSSAAKEGHPDATKFEDEKGVVKLDAKGNPIKPGTHGETTHGHSVHGLTQGTGAQFQTSHTDAVAQNTSASDFDSHNGQSFNLHGEVTSQEQARSTDENINFDLASNEETQAEIEVPDVEEIIEEEGVV